MLRDGMTTALRERMLRLPRRPGVYIFKDAAGNVLYVGKANNLKSRVAAYLAPSRQESARRLLMHAATDIETLVCTTEVEALALEATLIQKHEPSYNIRLVDDSSYLYVRISKQTYPRVELVRKVLPDGAWYRGPYPIASVIRSTLKAARKLFPWCAYGGEKLEVGSGKRTVPDAPTSHRPPPASKPCFAYHLGLCPGICVGRISLEEYQHTIQALKRFLDGDVRDALQVLKAQMADASAKHEYERAAKARDDIAAIQQATTPQHVVTPRRESLDALGVARRGTRAIVTILSVRQGRVIGARAFPLAVRGGEPTADVLRSFLLPSSTWRAADPTPLLSELRGAGSATEFLLPEPVEDAALLQPNVSVPRRGWKRRLLDLARANAEEAIAQKIAELASPQALHASLKALARVLRLGAPPHRIEAYDVSNIQGTLATGSMVVFIDGKPQRNAYKKFKITTKETPDDTAMMTEVLRRRFGKHAKPPQHASVQGRERAREHELVRSYARTLARSSEWPLPNLVLLDGGKGQRNAGIKVLHELGLDVPVVALAKREEELWVPGKKEPLALLRSSEALYLLQRIRDEAHRFTLGYHQLLRKKRMTRSILDEIPGVGESTRKKLLRTFGSLRGIRAASREELAKVVGPKLAETIGGSLGNPGKVQNEKRKA